MTQPEVTLRDRYRGSLLAGAVGDSLGAPIEFLSLAEIKETFGAAGITDYVPAYGRLGAITDDTQMTLFTADGLLRALVMYRFRGLSSVEGCVNHSYLRWLLTQGESSHCHDVGTDGWLFKVRGLHSRRAPGNTCVTALQAKTVIGDLYPTNDSKGCGGVMRVAPVAMMYCGQASDAEIKSAFEVGGNIARLTHGHPVSTLASGVMVVLVLQLLAGRDLRDALSIANNLLDPSTADGHTVWRLLEQALTLADTDIPPTEAIERLGEGWVAEEALSIGVYASLRGHTLEEALLMAVNHSGDSDSTGSIAGNLAGAMYGVQAIPERWLERLGLREVIQQVADDLHDCGGWELSPYGESPEAEAIWARYPGW